MKQSLTRNLVIGFGFSLLLLLGSSLASYLSIHNLLQSSKWVTHTYKVISELENIIAPVREAETAQRGFIISDDPAYLEPFHGAFQESLNALERVQNLTTDNSDEQQRCENLRVFINKRFSKLEALIDAKKNNNLINTNDLQAGKEYMDSIRVTILLMKNTETELLSQRIALFDSFSNFTPVIILIASGLSILIAVFFFIRVRRDIEEKSRLQLDLQNKDKDVGRRIDIIRGIAETISLGDYSVRINDEEKDNLGSLSAALNKMAGSLEASFKTISDKEWLQTGSARLSETLMGERSLKELTQLALEAMVTYTNSAVGAFYLNSNPEVLDFSAGYAFDPPLNRKQIQYGRGIVGECAQSKKWIEITDILKVDLQISYASGEIKPSDIYAFPLFFEKNLLAVVELGSLHVFSDRDKLYLLNAAENIGVALNTSISRFRLQELLEKTQTQTEELQTQHNELEVMNVEMEAQTEKLQVSEEELKVQQEELMQTNRELEERSKLLEEKNELIGHRNQEIQKKAEDLELSTRYKSEFLTNMSHELRTPLNSILLLSRLMAENKDQNLSKDQVEYAQVIQSSGNGLLELIDEILDLSKIEAGRMQLEYGFFRLSQIISDIRMLFDPLAKEKNLDFKIQLDPETPIEIETDKMRMEQILKNLLSNAFKFTKEGCIELNVKPDSEKDSRFIRFEVKDSGIGIPEDKQALIFDAFQQADGSTKRKFGGTGLGLSISRELSKLLNGDLYVSSEEGKGSLFTLRLPVSRLFFAAKAMDSPPVPAAGVHSPSLPAHVSLVPKLTVTDIPKDIPDDREHILPDDKIILIIEDDTNFAKALLEFTRKQQYKGIVAVRGDTGILLAKTFNPRGILLDIQLPVRNGWEVMEELKRDPKTRHIPVHIMSSFEARKESISKGAVDFINKPVAFDQMPEIFKRIEQALHQGPSKVLIVEENSKHAKALSYYLGTYGVQPEIAGSVEESIKALQREEVNCVILEMNTPDLNGYEKLQMVKSTPGLENIPIILFTGRIFSRTEEQRLRQYTDSIVIKTAHSYQRILDEVSLFMHIVDQKDKSRNSSATEKPGALDDVLKNNIVLVADDDVRNIFSLTKVLEQHKMKVIPAIDGKEALEMLQANPQVNIVLMDMMMPEMDGYESIKKIRHSTAFRDLPIIAVTAKAMAGDREKCISAGASDYISKPVDIDQLISLLRIWLYEK
jgi:signal transduction histidine kinase/DNA-binding response OmpR family regulator/CHASE3 domain sensor protein